LDEYSNKKIAAKGRQDGSNGIPALDDMGPTPYEDELLQVNRQMASKVVEDCKTQLEKIDGEISAAKQRLAVFDEDANQTTDLKHIDDEYEAEVEQCKSSPLIEHAQKEVDYTERAFSNVHARLNRMPIIYVPHWAYMLLAFLIGISEVPLNALVFKIFGEAQIMTWIMSAIIGLFVPIAAHFVGIKFREHGEGFSWPNAIKGVVVLIVVIAAFFVLALMRQQYLDLVKEDIGIDQRIVDVSFNFFWINLAVYISAVLIAYLSHDSVPGYPQLLRDKLKARENLIAAQESHHDCLKRALEVKKQALADNKQKMEQMRQKKNDLVASISRLEAEFDSVLKAGQEQEKRWLGQARRDIAHYRSENMRARDPKENGKMPKCFENTLDFKLKLRMIAVRTEMPEYDQNDESEESSI
jgi:hypothetical protein